MDESELPAQDDPREKVRAHARAMQEAGESPERIKQFIDGALTRFAGKSVAAGPITPGHSKFSADELRARADQSVDEATQQTMDAQGDLIHTLQAGAGAAEIAPVAGAKSIPAMLRGGINMAKSVGRNAGTVKDVLRLVSTGSPRAMARLGARLMAATEEAAATPFAGKAPVESAVEGVAPGANAAARAASRPTPIMPERSALERQFQTVVDDAAQAHKASITEGHAAVDPPTNWDLMERLESGLIKAQKGKKSIPQVPEWRRSALNP